MHVLQRHVTFLHVRTSTSLVHTALPLALATQDPAWLLMSRPENPSPSYLSGKTASGQDYLCQDYLYIHLMLNKVSVIYPKPLIAILSDLEDLGDVIPAGPCAFCDPRKPVYFSWQVQRSDRLRAQPLGIDVVLGLTLVLIRGSGHGC